MWQKWALMGVAGALFSPIFYGIWQDGVRSLRYQDYKADMKKIQAETKLLVLQSQKKNQAPLVFSLQSLSKLFPRLVTLVMSYVSTGIRMECTSERHWNSPTEFSFSRPLPFPCTFRFRVMDREGLLGPVVTRVSRKNDTKLGVPFYSGYSTLEIDCYMGTLHLQRIGMMHPPGIGTMQFVKEWFFENPHCWVQNCAFKETPDLFRFWE